MTEQPWTIRREHRIRWAECDLYGHVNHATYLTLFEDLRVDHWQSLTGERIRPDRPNPVVASLEVRYLRGVGFGDLVTLSCRPLSFRRTSLVHEYEMAKDGVPCCTARGVIVITRQDTGEKVPIWEAVRAQLRAQGAAEE
jgi:acyl-CoA thioester hydrolase